MAESNAIPLRGEYPVVRRISWGAIFAGVIIVLITHITLTLLGLAVGFSTVDPQTEQDPTAGLATGQMIWWLISAVLAIFTGAWAASRLSGLRTGILHGIVTWGLVELLFIYLLTSAVGTIIGGAMGIVETTMKGAAQGIPALVKSVDMPDTADVPMQQIQNEIRQILRQTGTRQLQPDQLEQETQQMQETAAQAAEKAVQNPEQAYEEIKQVVDKMLTRAEDVISEVDREAVVNVLVKRTDMTRPEARNTVQRWIRLYQTASQEVKQTAQQFQTEAAETLEDVGTVTADALTSAAWWSFFMLVVGAVAAAGGGFLGLCCPDDRRTV